MSQTDTFLELLGKQIAEEVLAQLTPYIEELISSERILYTEDEAAALLGMESRSLADERRDGRIVGTKIRQGRVRYLRSDLIKYANERRIVLPERTHDSITIH
ncbi:helix-turn-helix domain-containing protein [Rubinisphaera margarita]|uniref:helix-turn-helix domain-containing protein n=1 Tax=Rubinisphaera margarita TaxID=2909586 RepID=UPI001EE792E2|nr:helix-turn-helix domain-containing protein [Rubinisphaera margarita]MCG6157114.1 helix-turn-helix domain-containing protein [Rubinisphaera margarita]